VAARAVEMVVVREVGMGEERVAAVTARAISGFTHALSLVPYHLDFELRERVRSAS
jgi:hypothetical protein